MSINLMEPLPEEVQNDLKNEKVLLCLKGVFKEWLICTESKAYIFKKGYMTGHLFGDNCSQFPYRNISSVQVNKHLLTGYFEISTGGVLNTNKSYWSGMKNIKDNTNPAYAQNCISLNGTCFDKFREACNFINQKIQEISNPQVNTSVQENNNDIPNQIKKLAELKESGILTESEFEQKKAELLARM